MATEKSIRVLVFAVDKPGETMDVVLTLEKMYELTHAESVQMVPYPAGPRYVDLFIDEDGKSNGAQPNRSLWDYADIAFGDMLFAGPVDRDGVSTSLTDEDIAELCKEFDGPNYKMKDNQ